MTDSQERGRKLVCWGQNIVKVLHSLLDLLWKTSASSHFDILWPLSLQYLWLKVSIINQRAVLFCFGAYVLLICRSTGEIEIQNVTLNFYEKINFLFYFLYCFLWSFFNPFLNYRFFLYIWINSHLYWKL